MTKYYTKEVLEQGGVKRYYSWAFLRTIEAGCSFCGLPETFWKWAFAHAMRRQFRLKREKRIITL